MSRSRSVRRRLARGALVAGLMLVAAAPALADNVVADDQVVQGQLCVGLPCIDGEAFGGPALRVKADDTPAINLVQTGASFTAQTWDVAGNEANFFVRDVTGGSQLPFRIRPGAKTSSIEIDANSQVLTAGIVEQLINPGRLAILGAADGSAILNALRTLGISRYTIDVDGSAGPHLAPAGADFRAAFGLGASDDQLAPADVAAVALAAVKALDARVSALSLTPGPQGTVGSQGAPGAQGPAGATADLSAANKRIGALQRSNKQLAKSVKTLQQQVKQLLARKG